MKFAIVCTLIFGLVAVDAVIPPVFRMNMSDHRQHQSGGASQGHVYIVDYPYERMQNELLLGHLVDFLRHAALTRILTWEFVELTSASRANSIAV
ncbi:hypothetical protein GE061_001871 [Apolygus lucorum]|uniref:Uncharacterized protein n=1 Tax=Apolygus lucorum TaxID=248454 RepID=A0A6A4KFF0_APOLU|nr:hypothetical protein GE061_001871 [Apolygus lucorum]